MENENLNIGFDAANECMVDMISTGIIDPAKVSFSYEDLFIWRIKYL